MVLNSKIEVYQSGISGKGLRATEKIAKGEVTWQAEEDEEKYWYHIDVIKSWPEDVQKKFMYNAYQIKPNIYSGVPEGVQADNGEYMNHCCDPNTIFINDGLMIATRDIEAGEEVTYDYATSESETSSHMPFQCACGKAACRGTITGTDFLKPELRAKYAGHFSSMIVTLQEEADKKAAATA